MSEWTTRTAAAALAGLDGMGPKRLSALLAEHPPVEALERIRRRSITGPLFGAEVVSTWAVALRSLDPGVIEQDLVGAGVTVSLPGDPTFPSMLADDLEPPPVLFQRGRPIDERAPSVAIVGTRRCTAIGREVAREFGFGLAAAGVAVVSGLALGIDGCAHEGALAADGAPPIAFVGGGVDVVYPARHVRLWERVGASGTIASEAPPGVRPARWRFPARNRMIAAMADVVVVVESREAGGSMYTVDEAIRRDRIVMAVPGSVRNPAAFGTNTLLADGCEPACRVDDILTALGLETVVRAERRTADGDALPERQREVFDAIDDGATPIEAVVQRTGRPTLDVLAVVGELSAAGRIVDDGVHVRRASSGDTATRRGGGLG